MATPEFIINLREKVGHEMLWLTTAMGAVIDAEGRVLLGRRADTGAWALPGGIIDPAEHPADTAVREIYEETGVIAIPDALTGVSISKPIVYSNGDQVQYLEFAFRCLAVGGKAQVGDSESIDVGWYSMDALPSLDEVMLRHIEQAIGGGDKAAFIFSGLEQVLGPLPPF